MTPAGKIRLLYVIENERYGGGEKAFAQIINGLDKKRFEIFTACLTGGAGSETFVREIAASARVIRLDLRRLMTPSVVFALKSMILDNRIAIVHSQGARADFYARLAARGTRARLFSTVAAPVEEYDIGWLKKLVYIGFDRVCSSSVEGYIAVAAHIRRKLMARRGIAPGRISVIYNGVGSGGPTPMPSEISAVRARLGVPPGCPLAVVFCRLVPEKGLFTLLEAAAICAREGRTIKYLVAGEGPLDAGLRARALSLGLEKDFIFAGFVSDTEPLLRAADLAVLPSIREGFPMFLLEAMAAGKPVAASRIEGVDEALEEGVTGLLVPPGDPAALAGAIGRIAGNPASAAAMGERARSASGRFSLESMVRSHENLYLDTAGE